MKSDIKSKLIQFIHEELTSVFDYQDQIVKLNLFVKLATWHQPILLFASIHINTINILFSLASYFKVGLEVIEIIDKNLFSIITKAAEEGSWIIISEKKKKYTNNDIWKEVCSLLKTIAKEKKIINSFRFFVDCQEMNYDEFPAELIKNEALIFNLGEENNEEMEGFNDIWVNILRENILNITENQTKTEFNNVSSNASLRFLKEEEGKIETRVDTLGLFEGDSRINTSLNVSDIPTMLDLFYPRQEFLSMNNISMIKKLNETKEDSMIILEDNMLNGVDEKV